MIFAYIAASTNGILLVLNEGHLLFPENEEIEKWAIWFHWKGGWHHIKANWSANPQCKFLVNSGLDMATTMADLCRIHRQLICNICTNSRSFTRIFNKTRVNYKLFFILTQKLESTSFHLKNWHLVELFFIFWHYFLIVCLQTKRREISKSKYQNWFIFWKICW